MTAENVSGAIISGKKYKTFAIKGGGDGDKQSYNLLLNASATGTAVTNVRGGDYVWALAGTVGGATITLEYLGLDGVTYASALNSDGLAASFTAVGAIIVRIGHGATVRAKVTGGSPSGLYSNIAAIT